MEYYTDILRVSLGNFKPPDLKAIAENGSPNDMARLIQLMLGVAINCEQKDSKTAHTTYLCTHTNKTYS